MARYAQVHEATGFIANVIEWNPVEQPDIAPPPGYVFVEDSEGKAGPGGTYDGSTFAPPPPPMSREEAEAAKEPRP